MKLEKAIEILTYLANRLLHVSQADEQTAARLGIDALRHIYKYRQAGDRISQLRLAGETEEKERGYIMVRKWETRCWYCGSTDLEPDEKGLHCRDCGTTYIVVHKVGPSQVTSMKDPLAPTYGNAQGKSGSPSDSYLEEAARRRAAAKSD